MLSQSLLVQLLPPVPFCCGPTVCGPTVCPCSGLSQLSSGLSQLSCSFLLLLLLLFKTICLRESKRQRENKLGGAKEDGEADPPLSRDPDAGLDPGTPGS